MIKYSYNLFPKPFIILGYLSILLAFVLLLISLNSTKSENHFNDFAISLTIIIIGLIMISFRSKLIIDDKLSTLLKESNLLGMTLSSEKVKIPHNCIRILIKKQTKRGTGYYAYVIPVSYYFKAFDMYFQSETGAVRFISTDYKRSLKIANFLKSITKLEYILKNE
jgi:hypothetical protein